MSEEAELKIGGPVNFMGGGGATQQEEPHVDNPPTPM